MDYSWLVPQLIARGCKIVRNFPFAPIGAAIDIYHTDPQGFRAVRTGFSIPWQLKNFMEISDSKLYLEGQCAVKKDGRPRILNLILEI